jgi:hypothetical protein
MQTPDNLATNSISYYTKLYPNTTNTTFIPKAIYIQPTDPSATTMTTPTNLKKYKEGEIIYRRLCGTYTPGPLKLHCIICNEGPFTDMKYLTQHSLANHRTSESHYSTYKPVDTTKAVPVVQSESGGGGIQPDDDSISLTCGICNFDSSDENVFRAHKLTHENPCPICGNTFMSHDQFTIHMRIAHSADATPSDCEVCDHRYWTKAEYTNHVKQYHSEDILCSSRTIHPKKQLRFSGESTNTYARSSFGRSHSPIESLRHELTYCAPAAAHLGSEKINYCLRCDIQFEDYVEYIQHEYDCLDYERPTEDKLYHYDMTDYCCQNCGLDHPTLALLDAHQQTCTYDAGNYLCDCCGTMSFDTVDAAQSHEILCWEAYERQERREARQLSFTRK